MDEITDQFRTEDAEEFKQLQAELEVAGALHTSSPSLSPSFSLS